MVVWVCAHPLCSQPVFLDQLAGSNDSVLTNGLNESLQHDSALNGLWFSEGGEPVLGGELLQCTGVKVHLQLSRETTNTSTVCPEVAITPRGM